MKKIVGQLRKQGTYEIEFRKTVERLWRTYTTKKELIESHKLRIVFKNIIIRLFVKKHHDIKVITNNKELRELLTDKIWEEFYDIAKNKDIECAITIIFKRYEQ